MTQKMPEVEIPLQIPFYDVDLLGIVWHGHYLKYFEIARAALFDTFEYGYKEMKDSGFAWPVIDAQIRYIRPAALKQEIKVKAQITEYDIRLKVNFLVTDAKTNERIAKGHTIQVAVDMKTMKMCFGSPPILYKKLGLKP